MKKLFLTMLILLMGESLFATNVEFYFDKLNWESQVTGSEFFATDSTNISKADEVLLPPGFQELLGNTLTFDDLTTGLSMDFQLVCLEDGAQMVFDGHPDKYPIWREALSIGQINEYEDDDWEINILSGFGLDAFAFELIGNDVGTDLFSVYDIDNNLLGTSDTIPANGDTSEFIGIVSDVPIWRLHFNGNVGDDDIAIANFNFVPNPVPEPATCILLALGGLFLKRKR